MQKFFTSLVVQFTDENNASHSSMVDVKATRTISNLRKNAESWRISANLTKLKPGKRIQKRFANCLLTRDHVGVHFCDGGTTLQPSNVNPLLMADVEEMRIISKPWKSVENWGISAWRLTSLNQEKKTHANCQELLVPAKVHMCVGGTMLRRRAVKNSSMVDVKAMWTTSKTRVIAILWKRIANWHECYELLMSFD